MKIKWIKNLFKSKMAFELGTLGDLSAYSFDKLSIILMGEFELTINRNMDNLPRFIANWENRTTILSILYENDGTFIAIVRQDWK